MRKIYATLFLLLAYGLPAQDLVNSRITSYYTFIYKISNREAAILFKDESLSVDHSWFHTLLDFYPSDSVYKKKLPVGHYLFIKSVADKFETELESVNNLDMHMLNNNRDLLLLFLDRSGNEIKTVRPKIRNTVIPFDRKLNVYRISKTNKQGLIAVEHEGHTNFFKVNRLYNNTLPVRAKRRVLGTFPLNHILSPFTYTVRSVKGLIKYQHVAPPGIYYRIRRGFDTRTFEGYMALSQPKYKPGDTLRMKAFVTNKKGKSVNKNLEVYLNSYRFNHSFHKKLGELSPYRKGAYTFEIPLADSLKLSLDRDYSINLVDKRGNSYPGQRFHYEQYELKQNFFTLKESPSNIPDKPAAILLKGTDSNDMPLFDIRVDIFIKASQVRDFYEKYVFIPDTLWTHHLKLEPLGDTRVDLPDSLYPNGNFDYEISAVFTNADNERHLEILKLSYDRNAILETKFENDSIWFMSKEGESFKLIALNDNRDTLYVSALKTPHREKINPVVKDYHIRKAGNWVKSLNLYDENDQVEVMAQRTQDSLFIAMQNPRKIPFRYQLFKNNNIIDEGNGLAYSQRIKTNPGTNYYLSVQYLWAGMPQQKNYDLAFPKKPLSIEVSHPPTVFPGQEVDFSIEVKDAFGKPVEHTDLTAYAITKKFINPHSASIPQFERFKNRKAFNEFRTTTTEIPKSFQKLEYDFWRKRLGLDSISYYHFLYPDSGIFTHYTDAIDSITQVAPFVVKDGEVQPVHYVQFNRELKYYYEVRTIQPYSFRVEMFPVTQKYISIRLRDRLVIIPNTPVQRGRKLILSVDLDNLPDSILSVEMPTKLTEKEIKELKPHLLWVVRDPLQSQAYLQQGKDFHVLRPYDYYNIQMAGPFFPGTVKYQSGFDLSFYFKPMMRYEFSRNLIDRETYEHDFNRYLPRLNFRPSLRDQVFTKERILQYWKSLEPKPSYTFRRKYPDTNPTTKEVGRIVIKENYSGARVKRLATFILNLDHPDEYYLFPPHQVEFFPLLPGHYQVIVIYDDERYIKPGPVNVRAFGTVYYNLNDEKVFGPDDFSREVLKKIELWSRQSNYNEHDRRREAQDVRQLYYQESAQYADYSGGRWVSGVVTDETGETIPGVNVIVKGTTRGTVSDVNGRYRLYVPHDSQLAFSFIGYQTVEVFTGSRSEIHTQLTADVMQLSEVVVMGYGVQSRAALTMSASRVEGLLAGKVAGVQIRGAPGASDSLSIRIRGAASLAGNNPLVIIDGVLMRYEDIDHSRITAIEVINPERAIALYGSRAANGVILISTRPGTTLAQLLETPLPDVPQLIAIDGSTPGSSLRKNFRDYAFWQPKLRTDKNGIAKFNTTFPDDITGWKIYVLGMASKKRTGMASGQVQSFKPLIAQLALPNFLVEGDSAWAIGKITNYSADSVNLTKSITINDQLVSEGSLGIKNSVIDSISLTGTGDSLFVKYQIEYKGYQDGELRKLPVFPVGTMESKGIFTALTKDTTFTLTYGQPVSSLKLYAQADLVDVLVDEINALKIYPYECNEQLASKLKALLAEKTIRDFRKEKFQQDKLVEKILKKLISQQGTDGGWGWWTGPSSMWITLHIAGALDWAEKLAYKISYDRTGLKQFLMNAPSRISAEEQLKSWIYLSQTGERVIAKSLTDTLARQDKLYNNYYKLLAMRLLQLNGIEPDWTWVEKQKYQTLKGNYYWGEEKQTMWNNDVDNTLLVYKMLEYKNSDNPALLKIRNYFLEKRRRTWRNTYESSRIVETLLPSLQRTASSAKPTLDFSGGLNLSVTEFPFETELKNITSLTVSKKGNDPVYFSAFEEWWNHNPESVEKDFIIQTQWKDGLKKLKAGKPVTLEITLDVKKDAEYVMINVPIPAGCSYDSKNQSRSNGEVHREYDLHEARIYCERLRAGQYRYTIQLQPRYKGRYTLNPAKAEWMYFPVVYGRNEIKRVAVE